MKSLLAIVATTILVSTVQSFEPTYLPGGEEVKAAVAARRGQTELSKLALSMEPGTWAELPVERPRRMWGAPRRPDAEAEKRWHYRHIGTWSDDGHWDTRTGQFLFFGVRETRKLVAYSEEKNEWRDIPFSEEPNAPALVQRTGHQYARNALDPERSRYFTSAYGYDLRAETWKKLPDPPGGSSMTWSFFSAMDGLLVIRQEIQIYDWKRSAWTSLGASPVDGYHSLARHNPYRDEVLIGGGNNNSRTVARITKNGTIERLQDCPVDIGVANDKITVEPITGQYLIVGGNRQPKTVYLFDSARNEYRHMPDFMDGAPFSTKTLMNSSWIPAFIPEYGVIMWVASGRIHLYKHNPDGDYPVVEPKPEGDE